METAKRSTPSWLRIGGRAAIAVALGLGIAGCDGIVEGDTSTSTSNDRTGPDFERVSDAVGSVTGKIQDTNGAPLAGARIFVAGLSGTTDDGGIFRIDNVPVVNTVGADGAIAQTLPLTIAPPAGGNYLSATAVVTPQAQIDGTPGCTPGTSTVEACTSQTNPQTVFVDGYLASAGTIVIPQINSSIEFIARNANTGQLVGNVDFFLDFQGLSGTAQIPTTGQGAVSLESAFVSGVTADNGRRTLGGLADDSQYLLASRGFTINGLTNSSFGVSFNANNTVTVRTDAETQPVLVCDAAVTPKVSADTVNPWISRANSVIFEFNEPPGSATAGDSRISGALANENTTRGMLARDVRDNIEIVFSEPMDEASANVDGSTLVLDLTENPNDGLVRVVDHTATLSGNTLTFDFDSPLAEERKYDFLLLDGFFADTAGNPLVFNEQAVNLAGNNVFTLNANGQAGNGLRYEGPFASTSAHPLTGKGVALKTFTTLNTRAEVPALAQVCKDPNATGGSFLDNLTPTFEPLNEDDRVTSPTSGASVPIISNLNDSFGDSDQRNNILTQYLGQILADALIDDLQPQQAFGAVVAWQSAAVTITRTDEEFTSLLLQVFRDGRPQLLRNIDGTQNDQSKALIPALTRNVFRDRGIRILDQDGNDITSQVTDLGQVNPTPTGATGASSKAQAKNLNDPNKFIPITLPSGVNRITVELNQTTSENNDGQGTSIQGGDPILEFQTGDEVRLFAMSELGTLSEGFASVTLTDCVPPNLALQRSYCTFGPDQQVSQTTSGTQFGNGVELVGESSATGDLRLLGYKTPELLDTSIVGQNTDGTLNQELYSRMPSDLPANVQETNPGNATTGNSGAHDAQRYDEWLAAPADYTIGFEFTERVNIVNQPTHSAGQLTGFSVVNPDADGFSQPTRAEFPTTPAGGADFDRDDSYLLGSTISGTPAMFTFLNTTRDEVAFFNTVEDKAGNRNDGATPLPGGADNVSNAEDVNTLLLTERVPPFAERGRYDGQEVLMRFNETVVRRNAAGVFSTVEIDCNNNGTVDLQASFRAVDTDGDGDIDGDDQTVRMGSSAGGASTTAASGTVVAIPTGAFVASGQPGAIVPAPSVGGCFLGGAFNYAENVTDFNYPTDARDHLRLRIANVFDANGNSWTRWQAERETAGCIENGINSPDFLVIDDVGPFVVSFTTTGFAQGSSSFVLTIDSTHPVSNWFSDVPTAGSGGAIVADTAVFPRDGMNPPGSCGITGGNTVCNREFIIDAFAFAGIADASIANTSTFTVTSSGQRATLRIDLAGENVDQGDTVQIDGARFQGNGTAFPDLISDLTREQEEVENKTRSAGNN